MPQPNIPRLSGGKLAHTYSIVARDPATGEMGVAVQSHWFNVGAAVAWAEAGVGAIATQSLVNVSYGPRGLALLKAGLPADQVVHVLTAGDSGRDFRQLAVVDAQGNVAAYTGRRCIAEAGHHTGDGYSVQANLMLNSRVWPAMARAYEEASGPLAERLVAALAAAQAEGGDIRGQQSAALLVVRGQPTGNVWEDRLIDLRVDDHPAPVEELARLLRVHRAYEFMNQGDEWLERDDVDGALAAYSAAEALYTGNPELPFWHAVALLNTGQIERARPKLAEVFARDAAWREVLFRLQRAGLLKMHRQTLQEILAGGTSG